MHNQFKYESKEDTIKELKNYSMKVLEQPTVFPNISNLTVTVPVKVTSHINYYEEKEEVLLKFNVVFDENTKTGYISKDEEFKKYQEAPWLKELVNNLDKKGESTIKRAFTRNLNKIKELLNAEEVTVF